ncbi:hypothetical protein F511_18331 [Dorcoceras hygrometricum]|uniref:Uncharacterized protein n=1 Tax=Dorcoceras hygrometricum TaxID=472368 RepID=A0A2Z7CFA7_9LAMI|nr:hypothetical protein F511_18331 [Dorcoceras hygrometricum]
MTTGYECLPPSCDGLTGPDDHGPMISRLIDRVFGRPSSKTSRRRRRSPRATAGRRPVIGLVSITTTRSFRPCQNPSDFLVKTDGGSLFPVVDLIRRIYRRLQFKSQISLRILVGARRLDASKVTIL